MSATRIATVLGLAALAITLLPGCGAEPDVLTSPDSGALGAESAWFPIPEAAVAYDARGGYPLQPGNRWVHRRVVTSEVVASPDREADVLYSLDFRVERTLECVLEGAERTYVAEHTHAVSEESGYDSWLPMREDAAGLHELDDVMASSPCGFNPNPGAASSRALDPAREGALGTLRARLADRLAGPDGAAWAAALARHEEKIASLATLRAAPGRAAGGAVTGVAAELLRLAYPLGRGQRWAVREDVRFDAEVTGRVVIGAEDGRYSGWEIRYTSELYGPADRVFVAYGNAGYLGLSARIESVARDQMGNPIGTLSYVDRETIVSFAPARTRTELGARR